MPLEDMWDKQKAGINMMEEIYDNLFRELGYGSATVTEGSLCSGPSGRS